MRAKQLTTLLSATINARLPVLIKGAPGVGKSDIVTQAASAAGAALILSHPVVSDPTDYKGLPWAEPGADVARFLPFDDLAQAMKATQPTVWFLDDIGQASPAVQASLMQLLLARQVNGHALPDCVTFVAATNRRADRAGVSGILEPVKSRFATIVELDVNLDDWLAWANVNGIRPEVMAFLRFRPELIHHFVATADMTNSPSPRTWARVSQLLDLGLPQSIEHPMFAGAIGDGAAGEFVAFLSMMRDLPDIDECLLDPANAIVPTKASEQFAIATALGRVATEQNFARVLAYAQRLPQEFGVLCVSDARQRNAKITKSKAWLDFVTGPIGRAMIGENV